MFEENKKAHANKSIIADRIYTYDPKFCDETKILGIIEALAIFLADKTSHVDFDSIMDTLKERTEHYQEN